MQFVSLVDFLIFTVQVGLVFCARRATRVSSVSSDRVRKNCRQGFAEETCCAQMLSVSPVEKGSPKDTSEYARCTTKFNYIPADAEIFWMKKSADTSSDTCAYFRNNRDEIHRCQSWMRAVEESALSNTLPESSSSSVLSKFQFMKNCSNGNTHQWSEWIEPLSGMTRNPFAACLDKNDIPTEFHSKFRRKYDIDYILLQKNENIKLKVPGRKYTSLLFDLGTSLFDSSLHTLICKYILEGGIVFDRIFGWEREEINPSIYWNAVPSKWMQNLHFFNIPIPEDPSSLKSPLTMIKAIASPDDFVALKLDIDNTAIELAYFNFILGDKKLCELVDEMFFEYHYESGIMSRMGWGHTNEGNLSQALHLFHMARTHGIRLHFWP